MARVAIIYHSVTGTTARLAAAIAEGVDAVAGCQSDLLVVQAQDLSLGRYQNESVLHSLDQADAIVFGAPTFMGGPSGQFKCFADATSERWAEQRWEGKLAAGFTIGSNLNGDQLSTVQYFSVLAAQHSMLWLGLDIPGGYDPHSRNRLGAQLGLMSQTHTDSVPEIDLTTAQHFGVRIAEKTRLLTAVR
jgi:NAD(P)H dehydrogenase (quinone)